MRRRKTVYLIVILPIILIAMVYLGVDLINLSKYMYPYELREGANAALTKCFLQGVNPYSVETALNDGAPSLFYMYPFMYSLLVAGLSIIIPFVDLLLLHYIVSFACGIGAAVVGALIVRSGQRRHLLRG